MKYIILNLIILAFFLSSCNNKSEKQLINSGELIKTSTAFFSDSFRADTFKVVLKGKEPKKMLLTFNIITAEGIEIYKKVFKARDLIHNYKETVDLRKKNKQQSFITGEFDFFLDEENFLWPAITSDQKPDQHSPDKYFFKELQDSQLNGFKYRISKETKVYIAWSAKERRVKVYYYCC
ncbi:hypothetical protein AAKU52_001268 [Pedobacter sp. CG_S7]|uniref:hypothetical protein n=1 Tax=Pedobacter sp. CG_S7 TaxID=3143930 RepID=UPI003393F460